MSKKNLYKQILSSSKKVKDIISNKKFDYLNNVVINDQLVNINNYESSRDLERKAKEDTLYKLNSVQSLL